MEFVTLNNGLKMPMEGFGVYQVTNLLECEEAVYNAILAGYRLIDTASVYRNEEAVGNAIRRAIEEKIVTREELFITTKLWVQDYENVQEAIESSLKNLEQIIWICICFTIPWAIILELIELWNRIIKKES